MKVNRQGTPAAAVGRTKLPVHRLRDLTLEAASSRGRAKFVSAASGLAKVGDHLYVVADDENHIARWSSSGEAPGTLIRALEGGLPLQAAARKKRKPDFESVVVLPRFEGFPHGALMAVGSGSTVDRQRAVFWKLDAAGQAIGKPHEVNLARLYRGVAARCGELNIEGTVVAGRSLRLVQRGNAGGSPNMLIDLDLGAFLHALEMGASPEASLVRASMECELGKLGTVPLSFSDASMLADGRMVFAAVAEDTTSSYADGACAGSVIGVLSPSGALESLRTVTGYKIEGVHAERVGKRVHVQMVCDADDPKTASPLLSAVI